MVRRVLPIAVLLLGTARAGAWVTTIPVPSDGADRATAVATGAGRVAVAGVTGDDLFCPPFTAAAFDAATGELLWSRVLGCGLAVAVGIHSTGDVIVAGSTEGGCDPEEPCITVHRLDGATGRDVWSYARLAGQAYSLALDPGGAVLVAGEAEFRFALVALDAETGTERWRHLEDPGFAPAVALHASGAVLVAGQLSRPFLGALGVTKLRLDGTVAWQRSLVGSDESIGAGNIAFAVAFDGAGDAVAAGFTSNVGTWLDFSVVKLAGASGDELWRRTFDGIRTPFESPDSAFAVAIDRRGDVAAAGRRWEDGLQRFAVVRLAGDTGASRWERTIVGTGPAYGSAQAVAIDPAGDVLAAGAIMNASTGDDFTVVKLARTDGTELWRRTLSGPVDGSDRAGAIALDAAADVVAGGALWNAETGWDLAVATLSNATGGDPPCDARCRLDAMEALLARADPGEIDAAVRRRLLDRLARARALLDSEARRPQRGRGLLADFHAVVDRALRLGRIDVTLARRLLALVAPLLPEVGR